MNDVNTDTSRSPWVILAGVFVLAVLEHSLKYPLAFSESQTLVYAKQFFFPNYIAGDWYLSHPQLVRIPYQLLIYPLLALSPLHVVSLLGRLLGYLAVAGGVALVGRRLRIPAHHVWIGFGVYLMFDQAALPGLEWIIGPTESKVIAYALLLYAVHALMARRLTAAALWAGAATTMHILVGFWASLAIGLVVLIERMGDWRARLTAAGAWCLTASFALYAVVARFEEPAAPAGADITDIWVNFRNPHYTKVGHWPWDEPGAMIWFFGCLLVLALVPRLYRDRPQFRIAGRFALATAVPLAVTVAAAPTRFGLAAAYYLPFRDADTLVPLFACLLGATAAFRVVIQPRARVWVAAAALLVVVSAAGENFAQGLEQRREFPTGGTEEDFREGHALAGACDWFREHTRPGTLVVTSPDQVRVNYVCERPLIVTFRNIPSSDAAIWEWYQRLLDLNGGQEPTEVGYPAQWEIARNFQALPDSAYLALGRKYGGRYLMLRAGTKSELPQLYANRGYAIYLLDDAVEPTS